MARLRRTQPEAPTEPELGPLPSGGGRPVAPGDVREQRDALARELALGQWDLGGLAYEMAIRDHFRLDVLVRRAAALQEVDARLGVAERLARMDDGGAAGACPNCDTLYGRGAVFCSQCGRQLTL
jgi:hypothetical protein